VLAHPPIDVGRRDAGPDSLGDEREGLGGGAAGPSHAFDFGLAEDLDHASMHVRLAGARVQDRLDLARDRRFAASAESQLAWLT
jgi:hypothetical protein